MLVVGRSKNVGMPIAMLLHSDRNHERPGGEISVITLLFFFFGGIFLFLFVKFSIV